MLQNQYMTVAASRDKLQEEIDKLSLNRTGKHFHRCHLSVTVGQIFLCLHISCMNKCVGCLLLVVVVKLKKPQPNPP